MYTQACSWENLHLRAISHSLRMDRSTTPFLCLLACFAAIKCLISAIVTISYPYTFGAIPPTTITIHIRY